MEFSLPVLNFAILHTNDTLCEYTVTTDYHQQRQRHTVQFAAATYPSMFFMQHTGIWSGRYYGLYCFVCFPSSSASLSSAIYMNALGWLIVRSLLLTATVAWCTDRKRNVSNTRSTNNRRTHPTRNQTDEGDKWNGITTAMACVHTNIADAIRSVSTCRHRYTIQPTTRCHLYRKSIHLLSSSASRLFTDVTRTVHMMNEK